MEGQKITLVCTNNGITQPADIISETERHLKVVINGTDIVLELHREATNKPYVGHAVGLSFEYNPILAEEWKQV